MSRHTIRLRTMMLVGLWLTRVVYAQGDPDLGALAGQPVRLQFVMTECLLYSSASPMNSWANAASDAACRVPSVANRLRVVRDDLM
jgi:hypothetical protein